MTIRSILSKGGNKMEDRILLKELADKAQPEFKDKIVLARVNGKLCELWKKVYPDSKIEYITTAQSDGLLTYKRSATLIMLKAIYDVYGHTDIERVKVEFSLSKGYYCTVKGNVSVNDEFICRVKARMREIVDGDMPIIKHTIPKDEAVKHFGNHGMYDKEKLFRYRKSSTVNVYRLDGFEDYYYGYMVPSSGYIQHYELFLYDKGFVIQFPTVENTKDIPEFAPQNKLFKVLDESTEWCRMLGVETVGDLNETIVSGNIKELILVQEALQEKKLADIAQRISDDPSKKFIMIAGPSSSGKTTTSYRLAIQLRAHGMRPHQISLDNYFVNREFTPKDENGDYNFECLEALDIEQFNKDMTALLNGERVELPSFNFKLGKREYNGDYKELGPSDVLVIEGIHGLNDRLSYSLPKESKFKIYLSALTQLNIDEHNRIPTTDGRLIRRIVRDAQTRGTSAKKTIAMWPSVRKGEEENIFPFQEEADVMFNSALIYELALLKQYAEPLLFGIGRDEPEYPEANRLIKFLDYFLGIPNDFIPINSIAREFIGGSCFNV
mgnify:FL=1